MRILVFCAIVIAASTFASAVETVYGWSKLTPQVEQAATRAYDWAEGLVAGALSEGGEAKSKS